MVDPVRIDEMGEIVCDTDGCGHREVAHIDDRERFIGLPCPRCGATLLTREGFDAGNAFISAMQLLNAVIGDVDQSDRPLRLRVCVGIPPIKEID